MRERIDHIKREAAYRLLYVETFGGDLLKSVVRPVIHLVPMVMVLWGGVDNALINGEVDKEVTRILRPLPTLSATPTPEQIYNYSAKKNLNFLVERDERARLEQRHLDRRVRNQWGLIVPGTAGVIALVGYYSWRHLKVFLGDTSPPPQLRPISPPESSPTPKLTRPLDDQDISEWARPTRVPAAYDDLLKELNNNNP